MCKTATQLLETRHARAQHTHRLLSPGPRQRTQRKEHNKAAVRSAMCVCAAEQARAGTWHANRHKAFQGESLLDPVARRGIRRRRLRGRPQRHSCQALIPRSPLTCREKPSVCNLLPISWNGLHKAREYRSWILEKTRNSTSGLISCPDSNIRTIFALQKCSADGNPLLHESCSSRLARHDVP